MGWLLLGWVLATSSGLLAATGTAPEAVRVVDGWSKRHRLTAAAAALTVTCRTSTAVRVLRPDRAPLDDTCVPVAKNLGTVEVVAALPAGTRVLATAPVRVSSTPASASAPVPQEGYVWLGAPGAARTSLVSLSHDNRVEVSERRHWLQAQETLAIDTGTRPRGTVVRATAPVIALDPPTSGGWVPQAWAGTQFLLPAEAVRRVWLWAAGDTVVTWQQGADGGQLALTAQEAQALAVHGAGVLELRAEAPILVSAELTAAEAASSRQVAVPPASNALLGLHGAALQLLSPADQAATVAVRDSTGHTAQHEVPAGAAVSVETAAPVGVHLTAATPIAAWTLAADGMPTPLVPEAELGSHSAVDPHHAAWVICASTSTTFRVRVGTRTRTYACTGEGVGAVRLSTRGSGPALIEASAAVAVLQGEAWAPRLSTTAEQRPAAPRLDPLPARTARAALAVTGTADPATLVELRVNEASQAPVQPEADGRFAAEVPLVVGENALYAVAHDAQGTSEPSALAVVVRGKRAGGLTAQSLPASAIPVLDPVASPTSTNPELLTGTTLPGLEVRVFVDGALVRTVTADGAGVFSAKVPLDDGVNTITARAWDGAEESDDSAPLTVEYVNTIPRTQGGTIATDTVWTAGSEPYTITSSLVVPAGVEFWLMPGATLKFNSGLGLKLQVSGTVVIRGSETNRTVLTSAAATPAKSNWYGVEILAAGVVDLSYAQVEYANCAVDFNAGQGAIRHSLVRNSGRGVCARPNSTVVLTDGNEIRGNSTGVSVVEKATVQITGWNLITANSYGINADSDSVTANNPVLVVTGNSLYGNSLYNYYTRQFGGGASVVLDATGNWWGTTNAATIANSIYDNNDSGSLPIVDYSGYLGSAGGSPAYTGGTLNGPITTDRTLTGDNQLLGHVSVPPGVTLTLAPGAVIRSVSNWKLKVSGDLMAHGTETEPVLLTSAATSPAKGDWWGIEVLGTGVADLDHVQVEYANCAVDFNGGQGTVRHSLIRNNGTGVCARANSSVVLTDGNEIRGNGSGIFVWEKASIHITGGNLITANSYGINADSDSVTANNPVLVVTGNSLYGNSIYNYQTRQFGGGASVVLDATGNWWGTTNAATIANSIYDNNDSGSLPIVDYHEFLESADGPTALVAYGITPTQKYVDPLNGVSARIDFGLNIPSVVRFDVVNEISQDVAHTLSQEYLAYGPASFFWDGSIDVGGYATAGVYRVVMTLTDGTRSVVIDPPPSGGERSGSGTVPARYNVYKNEFWKMVYNVTSDSLVRMQVDPPGPAAPFLVIDRAYFTQGQHWVYWDGRDPQGNIVSGSPYVYFYAPERYSRQLALFVQNGSPKITGTQPEPNIEVKSDPYLVTHSYEQTTRMVYRLSHDAYVTFTLLPPGVTDPDDPSGIVLVANELQSAMDAQGLSLDHAVEWRGYDVADPNAIPTSAEGPFTFAIEARSPVTDQSTLYRGVVQLFQ